MSVLFPPLSRYDAYHEAARQFVISHASLTSKSTAAAEIDRVLTDCVIAARPAYLMLPTDLVHEQVSRKRLLTPLNVEPPENDPDIEAFVLDDIMKLIHEAEKDIVIIVDACVVRHNVKKEVKELAEKTGFPVFAAPMGKTAVSEQYERYGGVSTCLFYEITRVQIENLRRIYALQIYVGSISRPEVKERVENAKLILSVGGLKSDFNTGNFTYQIPTSRTIEVGHLSSLYLQSLVVLVTDRTLLLAPL